MRGAAIAAAGLLAACEPRMASTADSPGAYPESQVMPVDPVGIRPIPPIPAALRGCWQTDAPAGPEEPGAAHRLIVTATTVELDFPGSEREVATADFVERLSDIMIEGRFSSRDGDSQATVATSLELLDSDTLRRAEGDAGSDQYYRCP